jgi:hypothetical protein
VTTARDSMSFNENISVAGDATAKSFSALAIEPPIPTCRIKQERLDWSRAQNFGAVASEPARPIEANIPTSGRIGKTFHESIKCAGNAQVDCIAARLRESPLPWRRVRQILLAGLRNGSTRVVNLFRRE